MPSFLNWPSALIAAGAVVPLLLLLYFLKLRRQEVLIPSTLLWKKAIQDLQVNAPFQRLRRNLLLLLQLLLLLALLAAFARPVINYSPGAGKLAVIVIDRSASMSAADMPNGATRLDDAKRQAKNLVDTLDKDGSAMVIACDDSADIVRSFSSDRTLLKQAIDSIRPSDKRSRLKTACQLAEAKSLAFHREQLRPNERTEIWLYSDGRVADRKDLSLRNSDLKFVRIGTDRAANVAIVSLSARRNYEKPTEVQVFVRLANYGPEPAGAVLQISVDGIVPPGGVKHDLLMLPERWTAEQREKAEKDRKIQARDSAEFRLELTRGAVIKVEIKEQRDDLLRADDSAQIVVPPPRSLNVLLVSKEGNLWLEKFLQSESVKHSVASPAQFEEKMKDPQAVAAQHDVIMFDRWAPRTLPPAGNFVYFNVVPPDSKLKAARDEEGPIAVKDQVVLDWERSHPMLRGLNLRVYARETLKLQVPIDAQVLVEGRNGPMVVLYREGRHTHLVIGFDVQESTWPINPTFPVFFDNALQYLALGAEMELRQSYQPGDTPRIPRYNIQQAGADIREIKIRGPGGDQVVQVPPTGDFALPALDKVGLYTLSPAIPQFEKIAVNLLDDNESNLLPVDEAPAANGQTIKSAAGKARLELWWWLVAAGAIPLCLLEWWVYTRRVHL